MAKHRAADVPVPVPAQHRPRPIPVTDARTAIQHSVTDEEMAKPTGRYLALCGERVVAASLAAPPGKRCPSCGDRPPGWRVQVTRRHARKVAW